MSECTLGGHTCLQHPAFPMAWNIHPYEVSQRHTETHQAMETPIFIFLFVIQHFLFPCGFFVFVFHESTAGTIILTSFLAEILFCKHSLQLKMKTTLSFPTMKEIQSFFFPVLPKISKTHSRCLLNANTSLTSPFISGFLGTSQQLVFL